MKKSIKSILIVFIIVLSIGLLLFLCNVKNISASSLIDEDYVSDNVSEMRRDYAICGYTFDSETREMYEEIFEDDVKSGNTAFVGIFISGISVIAILICISASKKNKSNEEMQKQTMLLNTISKNTTSQTLEQKLTEIKDLKERGIISDEEYNKMREKILYSDNSEAIG